jgi:hypothetical protein
MIPKALRVLGNIWLYGAGFLILLCYGATWILDGFGAFLDLASPYNYSNFICIALTLAPAFFLQKMAGEIETKQYRKVLISGGAVFLSVAAVAAILIFATLRNSQFKDDASDGRTRKYQADSIRVKGKSATMYQHKNYFVTMTSGPVGSEGIPEIIQVGDVVTVKDSSIQVQYIFVTEFLVDMKYGSKILGKKGDVHCTIVQSREIVSGLMSQIVNH